MREKRIRVIGLEHLRGARECGVDVTVLDDIGRGRLPAESRRLRGEARVAVARGVAFVPFDFELLPRLLGEPPAVGDDRDTVDEPVERPRGARDTRVALQDERIAHTRQRLERGDIRADDRAAEHRALRIDRVLHARHRHVDAEQRLALHDERTIHARARTCR